MDSLQQTNDQPVINIVGEKVALGPIRRELVPLYHRWINDFAVLRTLYIPRPSTLEEIEAYFEKDVEQEKVRRAAFFTVYDRATMAPIGRTELDSINHRDRSASFGLEIGEAEYRGRGYGSETARLMLDYAFTVIGLHSVNLETWEYNLAGQNAYKKAGFKEYGRRRQAKFMRGQLWDIIHMDCLATEFVSPVLHEIMVPDKPRT
ncbi:30S ribosomal protein S5 alanine N-acetyltransferase [Dictyobacter vulcani]|uniref:30S ribosomal protein S5 alanine N-acetyltransferase n=1 Tax=Dictyobacter vulcani TaxID=2607529 RepID=A0A5J4KX85_9CHLR|nr:GNAT family protein [Dictyobacter vulcani]GER91147.1 30S ribosomal protein S5 alanine N-acetyltransferase [Dictyobacter vulcani]